MPHTSCELPLPSFEVNLKLPLASPREVYLDEIAGECVHSIRTLADKRNIGIEFVANEMLVTGDESLLRRLLINLLDNAVKYNHDNGRISITTKDQHLTVTNTGPQIPADEQAEIFGRFYRADKGRQRGNESSTSGAGLGLAISKWISRIGSGTIGQVRHVIYCPIPTSKIK